MSNRPRAQMGVPKIFGFMARSANSMVLLYRRRRRETFVLRLSYGGSRGDKLQVGSRFTGRFYPARCDLSPDGKHFVYFVMGGDQKRYKTQHYCWTAMCRPPQLTASLLLPHDDTWGGGGVFLDNHNLIVEGCMYDNKATLEKLHMKQFDGVKTIVDSGYVELRHPGRLPKLVDYGWQEGNALKRLFGRSALRKVGKRTTLVMREREERGKRGDFDGPDYTLVNNRNNAMVLGDQLSAANWAEFDRLGRLVLAVGHEVHIYKSPRDGMAAKPTVVLDLEKATEAS